MYGRQPTQRVSPVGAFQGKREKTGETQRALYQGAQAQPSGFTCWSLLGQKVQGKWKGQE